MILVGKEDIRSRISSEIAHFKAVNTCGLDYIVLMEDEWVELLNYLGCPNTKQTQFYHDGVPLVKEGCHLDRAAYQLFLEKRVEL
jgi:hypothetical protein